MSFFAKPNLDDIQFRQISGSTLTLEGTTNFISLSGLTLSDGDGGFIPVAADRNLIFNPVLTHGMVLGYDSTENRIRLMDISGGTGTNQYLGASPATITVGGISEGTELTGKTVSEILEELLVPTTLANVVEPFINLTTTPASFSQFYEVGSLLSISATINLNRGIVSPVYDINGNIVISTGLRSGAASGYTFSGIINSSTQSIGPISHPILTGVNTLTAAVQYSSGQTVYNSAGAVQLPALPAGSVTTSRSFTGIFPWFWGSSSTPLDISTTGSTQAIISGGTKVVGSSAGDIVVPNYNVVGGYIWFAVPVLQGSTPVSVKTAWQGGNSASNIGFIPGDLFPTPVIVRIASPSSLWVARDYRIYISSYPTSINYSMTFSN